MSTESDLGVPEYRATLQQAIESAIDAGAVSLEEITARCHGAGPEVVSRLISELGLSEEERRARAMIAEQRAALARARASNVQARMPAPDPEAAQWWFSLNAIERIAELVDHISADGDRVCFLGTPTVAAYFATRYERRVLLLDRDEHVLKAAAVDCSLPEKLRRTSAEGGVETRSYDVRNEVPTEYAHKYSVVVMDPPWYPLETSYFSRRAGVLGAPRHRLLSTYPGPLTRPHASSPAKERILSQYAGYRLLSRMPSLVSYRVPEFEALVHEGVSATPTATWRRGDVLLLEWEHRQRLASLQAWPKEATETYAKNPRELRLFLCPPRRRKKRGNGGPLEHVPEYSETVSRRGRADRGQIALWSSTKAGFSVSDVRAVRAALRAWVAGRDGATLSGDARKALQQIEEVISLPADTRDTRRTDTEQRDIEQKQRSAWAISVSARVVDEPEDGYRLPFARDRDRVVWSDGLRNLAGKTQVFSLETADNVRQRLAHSIEVMQLASTIASSFGLSRDLVEAGALAHDIGHTPFGHAGEHALNKVLNAIEPRFEGFNHYEHGVDVVRWLESPYRAPAAGRRWGLNLTAAVCECIFKHTYCIGGETLGQRELWERSKHNEDWQALKGDKPCHLEGQAVRLADKISYLVSDLEDGIRMGALTIADLRKCRLFEHAPLDYEKLWGESEHERYVSQRRALLSFLMEDSIDATAKRLRRGDWRSAADYTVNHSERVAAEVSEVWHVLQAGRLHKDARVIAANLRAARIVSDLFMTFAIQPALVDREFARRHGHLKETRYMQWYEQRATTRRQGKSTFRICHIPGKIAESLRLDAAIGAKKSLEGAREGEARDGWDVLYENVVMAKDFVASLSDAQARMLHENLVNGRLR